MPMGAQVVFVDVGTPPNLSVIETVVFAKPGHGGGGTEGQRRQFERQIEEYGRGSLEKSRASLLRRLTTHLSKLTDIRAAGGFTSSVEREIQNFEQQIAAIDEVLRNNP